MRKIATLIITMICFMIIGNVISNNSISINAEMNYYPKFDMNGNGEIDVYDFVKIKNQVIHAKEKFTEFDLSDVEWIQYYILHHEIDDVLAWEDYGYAEYLLNQSKVVKDEGNYLVLEYDGKLLNLVFNKTTTATEKPELIKSFDNVCIFKENDELVMSRDFNSAYFMDKNYTVKNYLELLKKISQNEIAVVNEYGIVFKNGYTIYANIGNGSNPKTEIELADYMLSFDENEEGKIVINFAKKPIDYSNVEANDDDIINIMRIMKGCTEINERQYNNVVDVVVNGEEIPIKFAKVTHSTEEIGEFYFGSSFGNTEYYVYSDEAGCICLNIINK